MERAAWAMLVAAFLVGLPIFFEVGFVIMAPLVWNLARETKRSLLFYGLPMAAALTITHSLVPPHPAPAAAAQLLGADLGRAILYGIALSIPLAIVARDRLRRLDRAKRMYVPVAGDVRSRRSVAERRAPPPAAGMVVLLLLLPVLLIFGATVASLTNCRYAAWRFFWGTRSRR